MTRLRISVIPNNTYDCYTVEYCDLDTGKTAVVDAAFGECRVFEISASQAERLFRDLAWEAEQDGIAAGELDSPTPDD